MNHNYRLFGRFNYFLKEYKDKLKESIDRKDERIVTDHENGAKSISIPYYELNRNAEWLALAAIDAFYSWTEHIFIHAAIIHGKVKTGVEVANLADGLWATKFKTAIDTRNPKIKKLYDQLSMIKRQIRNYMVHGAFGKIGEAFQVHSGAGAIPLLMPHQKGNNRFSFQSDLSFQEAEAISTIENFIRYY